MHFYGTPKSKGYFYICCHFIFILFSHISCEVWILIPVLQMRILRLRMVPKVPNLTADVHTESLNCSFFPSKLEAAFHFHHMISVPLMESKLNLPIMKKGSKWRENLNKSLYNMFYCLFSTFCVLLYLIL